MLWNYLILKAQLFCMEMIKLKNNRSFFGSGSSIAFKANIDGKA
tara:strand:- start:387 stop:518 length:132 start_codon:yes stop_codon:yes gene_type:complete